MSSSISGLPPAPPPPPPPPLIIRDVSFIPQNPQTPPLPPSAVIAAVVIGQNQQGQSLVKTANGDVYLADIKPPPAQDTPVIIQTSAKTLPPVAPKGEMPTALPEAKRNVTTAQVTIYKNEIARNQDLRAVAHSKNAQPITHNINQPIATSLPPIALNKVFTATIIPRPDMLQKATIMADLPEQIAALSEKNNIISNKSTVNTTSSVQNGGLNQSNSLLGEELALILNPLRLQMSQNQNIYPAQPASTANGFVDALIQELFASDVKQNALAQGATLKDADVRASTESRAYENFKPLSQNIIKAEITLSAMQAKTQQTNAQTAPSQIGAAQDGGIFSNNFNSATILTGTILSNSAQGSVILTADSLILLNASMKLEHIGQTVSFKITAQLTSGLNAQKATGPFTPSFADIQRDPHAPLLEWQNLQDFIDSLSALMPSTAQNIKASLPQAGSQFVPAVLFFLSALKGGQIDDWIGNKITTALKVSGKGQSLQALEKDFLQLSKQQQEGVEGEWRAVSLPLLHDNQISKIQLFSKSTKDDGVDGALSVSKRFILNFKLSALGAFQIDGRLQDKILDTMIRTEQSLPTYMRHDITTRYQAALDYTGHQGVLTFQTGAEYFISVLTRADAQMTNVDI